MDSDLSKLGRYTDVSVLILLSLASGPKHGYAMMEDILQFSGTHLEPGTLYGALIRVERKGWITTLPEEDRRRPYQITEAGREVLRQQIATLQHITAVGTIRLARG
jgi:DNA-binding PadR family transcriptional regulator